ncbi:MAG: IclR family transcriptional regulator [Pseudomonadota bacterium]
MEVQKRARGRPKSRFNDSSPGTLQSLDRALLTLNAVAKLERCTLSDLSRETGLPAATTHRILSTLSSRGYVSLDDERQEWMIGIETYRAGISFLKRNSVIELARPFMRRLVQTTGETANLAVPDGGDVVFVGQVESKNPIRAFFPPGSRTPMYASGTGKALLAVMQPARLDKTLKGMTFEGFTKRTHSDSDMLRTDLEVIRKRGWSHDVEERYIGMSCIGAAILNEQGEPCAGISVSGPSARFDDAITDKIGEQVANAAQEISLAIGCRAV